MRSGLLVSLPSPCLGLAERLGCSPSGRERALYRERHSVVFGVIDPAVAASGDDQGVLAVADPRLGVLFLPWRLRDRRHRCPTMAIVDMTTATSILRITLPPPLEVQVRTLHRSSEINEAIARNAGGGDPMEHDCGGRRR